MAITRPIARWNFAENPGVIDPRFTALRSGVATYMDVDGLMKTAPSNVLRWHTDPVTRRTAGLLLETVRTNSFWHSRDLTQAQWVKANATITANTANAADGTAALDQVAITGTGGYVAQTVTITAGQMVAVSVFARAGSSAWLQVGIQDGVNIVLAWFNLNGAEGTASAGADTVTYFRHKIEDYGGGLYRCTLVCFTNTSTSIIATVAPCANDLNGSINGNTAHMGDLQFEVTGGASLDSSSLITTAGAAVGRNAEGLTISTASIPGFSATEGSFLFEGVFSRDVVPSVGPVYMGLGDTSNNTIYVTYSGGAFYLYVTSGGVNQTLMGRAIAKTPGARFRVAVGWKLNDVALVVNGGVPNKDTASIMPVSFVRAGLLTAPWGTTGSGPADPMTMAALWNTRLNDADLQALSSPSPV